MRQAISILLMLLAATGPLLASSPCYVDCMARNPAPGESSQHFGMHGHANPTQPSGASVSPSTCGSHAAVALDARVFVLTGSERAPQANSAVTALECCEEPVAHSPSVEDPDIAESASPFPAKVIPLRI